MIVENAALRALRGKIKLDVEFSPLTILCGRRPSGKTLLMSLLHRLLLNPADVGDLDIVRTRLDVDLRVTLRLPEHARRDICRYFKKYWNENLDEWSGRLVINLSIDRSKIEYVVKLVETDEPLLHIVNDHGGTLRVRRPIATEFECGRLSIDGLYKHIMEKPEINAISSTYTTVRIVFEFVLRAFRHIGSVSNIYVDQCEDFSTCLDLSELPSSRSSPLVRGAELLAHPKVAPRLLAYLNQAARRAGFGGMSIGMLGKILTLSLQQDDEIVVCPELPRSLKSYVNLVTSLLYLDKSGILFVENFDYCLSDDLIKNVLSLLRERLQRGSQIILECRSSDVASLMLSKIPEAKIVQL